MDKEWSAVGKTNVSEYGEDRLTSDSPSSLRQRISHLLLSGSPTAGAKVARLNLIPYRASLHCLTDSSVSRGANLVMMEKRSL